MRNTGLNEAQAGIKIAERNINSLRYTDDITLMDESKEELKSLLMKVKEGSEKVGGGIGMGKTCEPMAFSFQCMTKFTTNKKKRKKNKK